MLNIIILPWMEEHPTLRYVTSWFTLPASIAAMLISILAAVDGSFLLGILSMLAAADLASYSLQFIFK